jgi:hypothetical protein
MKFRTILLLLTALIMSECGPTQKITGSWANPEAKSEGPEHLV